LKPQRIGPVDVHHVVGDFAQATRRVRERVRQHLPGELAGDVVGVHQQLQALARILFVLDGAERVEAHLLLRPVFEGL